MGRKLKYGEETIKKEYRIPASLVERLEAEKIRSSRDVSEIVVESLRRNIEGKELSLRDELRLALREVFPEVAPAVAAAPENTVKVMLKETMLAPCGEPRAMHYLVNEMGEGEWVEIKGALASLVTPNSYLARADGTSMKGDCCDSISSGDRLLMTPLSEYPGEVKSGSIVFARLHYKSGGDPRYTLKTYVATPRGKKLSANNPLMPAPVFGEDVEKAEVAAVCRGVVEKVFG